MLQKKHLIPFIIFTLSQSALALNLQGYQFTDSYRYSLLDDSLQEKFEGHWVATASIAHVNSPFYYSDTYLHDLKKDIIDYNNILTLGFSYYLKPSLSVGVDVSGVQNRVFGETYTRLGDSILKARWNVLRQDTWSLSINPQVSLPTGDEDNFTSQGSVGGALSVVGEKSFGRLHLLASLGGASSKDNRYVDVDHRQLLLTQLGVSYDISEKFNLNLESFRKFPLVDDTKQDEGKYFLTAKHKTHANFSTYAGAGFSGPEEVQRQSFSVFIGMKFHEKAAASVGPAALAMVPQKEEAKEFDEVYFAHASSDLTDKEIEKLDSVVEWMKDKNHQDTQIVIEGYASLPGSVPYNLALSKERARNAKEYLVRQGVDENNLSIFGFGEEFDQDPVEAKNRKIILRIK